MLSETLLSAYKSACVTTQETNSDIFTAVRPRISMLYFSSVSEICV
jgi:hypothetical protein